MSHQTRIDQFYKSTTNKITVIYDVKREKEKKTLRLSKNRREKNHSVKSSAKATSISQVNHQDGPSKRHSTQNKSFQNLPSSEFAEKRERNKDKTVFLPESKPIIEIEDDAENITENKKREKTTIKEFAAMCNSPTSKSPQNRNNLSLTNKTIDRNSNCRAMTLISKESLNLVRNIESDFLEMETIEATDIINEKNHENVGKTRAGNIVGVKRQKIKNSDKKQAISADTSGLSDHGEEDSKESEVTILSEILQSPEKKITVENYDILTEKVNGSSVIPSDIVIKSNITPKKRKRSDLLNSLDNSPGTTGWRVLSSIESREHSMTKLASNWEDTLKESSNRLPLISMFSDGQINTKSIGEFVTSENSGSLANSISLQDSPSFAVSKSSMKASLQSTNLNNSYDDSRTKSSPRRSLFSPGSSSKKCCFEVCYRNSDTIVSGLSNRNTTSKSNSPSKSRIESHPTSDFSANIIESTNSLIEKEEEFSVLSKEQNETSNSSMKKQNQSSHSSRKENEASNSLLKKQNVTSISPRKQEEILNSPLRNQNVSLISPRKQDGNPNSPKTPTKANNSSNRSSFSPKKKFSPRKPFIQRVDLDLATRAVENLNHTKQGVIPLNDFDLSSIYANNKSFKFKYGVLNTNTAIKYEARDVNVPEERNADDLFMVLVNVFSEPVNCGYFNEEELDTVFSMLTLTQEAQTLLARMLKRKRGWHRVENVDYPDIAPDLRPVFQQLVNRRFFDDDISAEDTCKLLSLLHVKQIRDICRSMKVDIKGAKPEMISNLLKLLLKKTSLFPGMTTPSTALKKRIQETLGLCVRLRNDIEDLMNRIFILLMPTQDPKENIVDAFLTLTQIHNGQRIFPPLPEERFPIFRNRLHLIRYAEARSAWNQIINASELKNWLLVRELGEMAYTRLYLEFQDDDRNINADAELPSHVKRFDANYVWSKVVWKSIEGFKKIPDGIPKAATMLAFLIDNRNRFPCNSIRWFSELALIEMYHKKDLETSANLTIEALTQNQLSEIDVAEMLERARKLLGRSKGISAETKSRISAVVELRPGVTLSEFVFTTIEAQMIPGNTSGSKSVWLVPITDDTVNTVCVEGVALRHYKTQGFSCGLHCEGSLPVTLFATLFWNEIYGKSVPGAFVSPYQDAPLDLYTLHFIENRRELIVNKLELVKALDIDSISEIMYEDFLKYRHYESLIKSNLFEDSDDFKKCIKCLGVNALVGICERLANNYNQWKSGFPDLVLWNPTTSKCKIVEVKGPGDSLSTKQKLWIQYLRNLEVDADVCVVKDVLKK